MRTNMEVFGTTDVPEFDELVIIRRLELLRDKLEKLLDHSSYKRTEAEAEEITRTLKDIHWHENINKMGQDD